MSTCKEVANLFILERRVCVPKIIELFVLAYNLTEDQNS